MIKINFANMDIIDLISEFELSNFNNEAYSKNALIKMLEDNYILKNNDNILIIQNDDEFYGYIIFHISEEFTDIYKIFIRESNRKQNLATELLNKVEELSKKYNSKKIMIEVRSKNQSAINLYEKNNYKKISLRKDYYKEPFDDAIIYEKILEV